MDVNILINNEIDVNKGLELLGDMDMYNETLGDFLTEQETRVPNMVNYYNAQDMVNYEVLVHAMKSDSKYLGFTKLADMAYQHELASKENNYAFVSANINDLMAEVRRIEAVVKQYLGRM